LFVSWGGPLPELTDSNLMKTILSAAALALLAASCTAPSVQREAVNPWDWGLQFQMNQAEAVTGITRHLHCSGQVSVVPDASAEFGVSVVSPNDIRGQMQQSFANVDAMLAEAGMVRGDILHLNFFTTDMDGFLANYDVYAEWIGAAGINPPQSLIGVSRLFLPELKVEVEVSAGQ